MQIAYIESQYNCSGFCTPPLFYISQSIERGVPQQACFEPVIKDIDYYLNSMRVFIKIGMVLLVIMMAITYLIMKQQLEEEKQMLLYNSPTQSYRKSGTLTFRKSQTTVAYTPSPGPQYRR